LDGYFGQNAAASTFKLSSVRANKSHGFTLGHLADTSMCWESFH